MIHHLFQKNELFLKQAEEVHKLFSSESDRVEPVILSDCDDYSDSSEDDDI